jgi:beta-glucosidase
VEYFQGAGDAIISFAWKPAIPLSDMMKDAKKYDAIVYCAGFNPSTESEGSDRKFELPADQVASIRALAQANPHVIVVLNSGGGVAWNGWLDRVPAVVEAWYSGEQIGRAVAEILFGDVNPSGKLPATFEKRWEDNPSSPYYHINDNSKTPYTEGVFVGYRGYDKNKTEPQFCFGYGLSYTTFEFGGLKVVAKGTGESRIFNITCTVGNTGDRAGAEVAQLYVGQEQSSVPRPIRELKGFNKVMLQPGETKKVTFTLSAKDLAFYDVDTHAWKTEPGKFNLWVGSSSRDLPLHGEITW